VGILVTVLGHLAGPEAVIVFRRATLVIAISAFTAGLVALLLVRRGAPRTVTEAAVPAAAGAGVEARVRSEEKI